MKEKLKFGVDIIYDAFYGAIGCVQWYGNEKERDDAFKRITQESPNRLQQQRSRKIETTAAVRLQRSLAQTTAAKVRWEKSQRGYMERSIDPETGEVVSPEKQARPPQRKPSDKAITDAVKAEKKKRTAAEKTVKELRQQLSLAKEEINRHQTE
jgi:hypothetical protein